MSNSASRVMSKTFTGASPKGSVEDAYFLLVLKLLESRNAAESDSRPSVECTRQVFALVGTDDLAAKDFAQRLNYLRS